MFQCTVRYFSWLCKSWIWVTEEIEVTWEFVTSLSFFYVADQLITCDIASVLITRSEASRASNVKGGVGSWVSPEKCLVNC
jgi:accessory gene regulator protein AgrB